MSQNGDIYGQFEAMYQIIIQSFLGTNLKNDILYFFKYFPKMATVSLRNSP